MKPTDVLQLFSGALNKLKYILKVHFVRKFLLNLIPKSSNTNACFFFVCLVGCRASVSEHLSQCLGLIVSI